MLIVKIINFLRGYVVFNAEGYFVERFLNIAAHRSIYLWNIRRLGTQKMRMSISKRGWELVPEIAEKTESDISIVAQRGIPFLVEKYRKRTAFLVGFCLFFIMIYVLSMFIWAIDIDYDGEKVAPSLIQSELDSAGLRVGRLAMLINKDDVARKLMTDISEFSWVGVNIQGTRVNVQIEERREPPEVEDKTIPCNIVSKKAGVIESINTRLGVQLVKSGDAVAEGQLLVSGVADSEQLGVRYLHATAEVFARTWMEKSMAVQEFEEIVTRTGKKKSKHTFEIFGWNIPLFISDRVKFSDFDRISEIKQMRLSQNLLLPFILHYDKFYEVTRTKQPISREEAILRTKSLIIDEMLAKIEPSTQILGEEITTSTSDAGEIVVTVEWECLENIGRGEEILNDS